MSVFNQQKKICKKFGLMYEVCDQDDILYLSKNFKEGEFPIEGKRYEKEGNFSGWYIWTGEKHNDKKYFNEIKVGDIVKHSDLITKFLGLESGTRILIEEDYMNAEYDYRVVKMID